MVGTRSWLRTTYLPRSPATRSLCASAACALRSHAPRSPRCKRSAAASLARSRSRPASASASPRAAPCAEAARVRLRLSARCDLAPSRARVGLRAEPRCVGALQPPLHLGLSGQVST